MDALGAEDARVLRAHLETCEGCRNYFEQMTAVARSLEGCDSKSTMQASEAFHERVSRALAMADGRGKKWETEGGRGTVTRTPVWENVVTLLRAPVAGWVVGGVALLVALALITPPTSAWRHTRSGQPAVAYGIKTANSVQSATRLLSSSVSNPGRSVSPTLANYLSIANRSLEQLDELLTQEERSRYSSSPVYSASALGGIKAAD